MEQVLTIKLTPDQKKANDRIVSHYGEVHQLLKLVEELRECADAVESFVVSDENGECYDDELDEMVRDVCDEIADVHVCMDQTCRIIMPQVSEVISDRIQFKIDRQLARMKRGE
jgi:NTP pyrophosphatase (non-canonical NTP hydrolase)